MVTVLALDQDLAVVAASGVVAVAIVAMTAQVGATSRAPIAQHALGPSTVVLRHRHADELVESDKTIGWHSCHMQMNSLSQTNHRMAFLPHASLLEVFLYVAVFVCNLQMNSLSQANHRMAFLPHASLFEKSFFMWSECSMH
jgi:hypothetical protein